MNPEFSRSNSPHPERTVAQLLGRAERDEPLDLSTLDTNHLGEVVTALLGYESDLANEIAALRRKAKLLQEIREAADADHIARLKRARSEGVSDQGQSEE